MQRETVSIDPHFSLTNPSVGAARHVFDTLAHPDERQRMRPALALTWQAVTPTEWEYRLRPNVRFHDGAPFTAEDVAFSLARAPNVPGVVGGFGVMPRQITGIRVVDPLTIRLTTATPFPLMTEHLSAVPIVSRAVGEGAQTADYNSGKSAIGTGPFRFVSWTRGDRLRLTRNDGYWAPVAPWSDVTIRPITDDGARVAALLSGAVDAIDMLPSAIIATIRARGDMRIAAVVSNRVAFLGVNMTADPTPFTTGAAGNALPRNPFADQRVRRAMSKAINREAVTSRVLDGQAVPAAQFLPDGYPGTSRKLFPEAYDPDGARSLLAEAGYPQGFNLVLLATRDRGANDIKVAEAIAQMLTRVGVRTSVDAMPYSTFQPRYMRTDFALALRSWGTETGEGSMALRAILGTRDPVAGWGMINGGRYSNPMVDTLLTRALATLDSSAREVLVSQATELALNEQGVIPLHYDIAAWAMRPGVTYAARSDNYSFSWEFRPIEQ